MRGAAAVKAPASRELARRYCELAAENLGQPGFRELLLCVHDIDARSDLVFALLGESRRGRFGGRPTAAASRREVFDLSGVGRDYLADAVAGALALPIVTEPQPLRFAPDSYWRGETHRLCDRPSCLDRLLHELSLLEVDQAIVVSASPETAGAHTLSAPRLDLHGRVGEYLQSSAAAAVSDLGSSFERVRLFTIRPAHNPIGPFDFAGGFDDRSDRCQRLEELITGGYEDAYRQFVEPVVGASGDRVGQL
jgi:hypothetical protein